MNRPTQSDTALALRGAADIASFYATIAYGLAALVGLLLACLHFDNKPGAACALLGLGAAYIAQAAFTRDDRLVGAICQAISIAGAIAGFVFLLFR